MNLSSLVDLRPRKSISHSYIDTNDYLSLRLAEVINPTYALAHADVLAHVFMLCYIFTYFLILKRLIAEDFEKQQSRHTRTK